MKNQSSIKCSISIFMVLLLASSQIVNTANLKVRDDEEKDFHRNDNSTYLEKLGYFLKPRKVDNGKYWCYFDPRPFKKVTFLASNDYSNPFTGSKSIEDQMKPKAHATLENFSGHIRRDVNCYVVNYTYNAPAKNGCAVCDKVFYDQWHFVDNKCFYVSRFKIVCKSEDGHTCSTEKSCEDLKKDINEYVHVELPNSSDIDNRIYPIKEGKSITIFKNNKSFENVYFNDNYGRINNTSNRSWQFKHQHPDFKYRYLPLTTVQFDADQEFLQYAVVIPRFKLTGIQISIPCKLAVALMFDEEVIGQAGRTMTHTSRQDTPIEIIGTYKNLSKGNYQVKLRIMAHCYCQLKNSNIAWDFEGFAAK